MKWFVITAIAFALVSCSSSIDSDEMWREKVDVDNGAYVYVYHNSTCSKHKPFLSSVTEKKMDFKKMKYDVFDFCFSDDDLQMMSSISRRNINDYVENAGFYMEEEGDYKRYRDICEMLDSLPCLHETQYACKNNSLIKLKGVWLPTP